MGLGRRIMAFKSLVLAIVLTIVIFAAETLSQSPCILVVRMSCTLYFVLGGGHVSQPS